MKKILSFVIIALFFFSCTSQKEAEIKLSFNEKGRFKVMQLSDIHWEEGSPNCAKTIKSIQGVIEIEKPQLVVVTGDVVTKAPALEGWKSIIKIFEDLKQPYAIAMGNHDPEFWTRDSIYDLLAQSKYHLGEYGPKNITGGGNYAIPIYDSKTKSKKTALVYCFDSNDYANNEDYGHYDWIHNDQINWYREISQTFTKENDAKPIPAIACFHIPLPEYKAVSESKKFIGNLKDEGIGSADINSGLFNAFIECKDVMGVFAGHDHTNDIIGMHYGIALAYGRVSGWDAYGEDERGCRIIELYEGEHKFDSWLRTPKSKEDIFFYPSGLSTLDEKELELMPSMELGENLHNAVNYKYYEGNCEVLDEIEKCKLVESGQMPNFSITQAKTEDHFAYVFESFIKIPKTAVYRFSTFSDDGSALYIDNQKVVDNDGGHSTRLREGKAYLEAGFHKIKVAYFENYMGQELKVSITSAQIKTMQIPDSMLFCPPNN